MAVPAQGPPVNVPIRMTVHCIHIIPANDTKESVFGPPLNFPRRRWGSNPGPLAPETSALSRFWLLFVLRIVLIKVLVALRFERQHIESDVTSACNVIDVI